ncbi:Uncharacterised protein [Klebsiella pneumoniae]|uniref:Uncharacterized protein n=1 Tax=Klebsiella pneumoniae TaxID=573 RepID=A0A2X3EMG6_KLEPN|nr:Uncharacterised protein [Klebsiella pneumoniae]
MPARWPARTGQTAAPTPTECAYAVAVRQHAAHQRAGQQAEDPGAEDPAHLHFIQRKGLRHADGGDPRRLQIQPFHQGHHKTEPDGDHQARGVAVVILVIGYLSDSRTNGAGDWRLMLCQPHVLSYLLRLSRSSATSTIISSWPPTIRRLPSSTRISTALRP